MRTTVITMMLSLAAIYATAQTADSISLKRPPGKNEAGLFVNPFSENYTNNYIVAAGLQYKRWTTEHLGYRIVAAVGGYDNYPQDYTNAVKGDTAYRTRMSTSMPMLFVGGGLELQHRFIGNSYLYMAVESKLGYGEGYTHIMLVKEAATSSPNEMSYYEESVGVQSDITRVVTLDMTPFIGTKVNLKRWCIGTELTAFTVGTIREQLVGMPAFDSFTFSAGQLQQRFYLNYRF